MFMYAVYEVPNTLYILSISCTYNIKKEPSYRSLLGQDSYIHDNSEYTLKQTVTNWFYLCNKKLILLLPHLLHF